MKNTVQRKAILTGASGGIGEEMAKILLKRGYSVVLVGRNKHKLEEIVNNAGNDFDANCFYFVCDLEKEDDVARLIAAYPETDVLINNAGFCTYGFYHKLPWEKEQSMIAVNLIAVCRLSHHYVRGMMIRNYGKILNVASTAGLTPVPFCSTYSATKAFIINFSKSLALELKDSNVSVSCLLPGPTNTGFWDASNMTNKVSNVRTQYSSPREVAEFGIRLMEQGKVCGIPGLKNRLKQTIKHYFPEWLTFLIMRKHMLHPLLYTDDLYKE